MLFKLNPIFRNVVRLAGNRPWKVTKLNHVAIAVPNAEKASAFYRDILGADVGKPKPMKEFGVTTVFVKLKNTNIELLEPLGDNSPIAKFLERNKEGGMHHICVEVDDVYKCMEDLKAKKIRTLAPEPKTGAGGAPVVFLHPKDTCNVLIEMEHVPEGFH